MALWELSPPIFLGTLAAIVVIMLLSGNGRALLRGPRRAVRWLIGGGRRYGNGGCGHGPSCGCGKTRDWDAPRVPATGPPVNAIKAL